MTFCMKTFELVFFMNQALICFSSTDSQWPFPSNYRVHSIQISPKKCWSRQISSAKLSSFFLLIFVVVWWTVWNSSQALLVSIITVNLNFWPNDSFQFSFHRKKNISFSVYFVIEERSTRVSNTMTGHGSFLAKKKKKSISEDPKHWGGKAFFVRPLWYLHVFQSAISM